MGIYGGKINQRKKRIISLNQEKAKSVDLLIVWAKAKYTYNTPQQKDEWSSKYLNNKLCLTITVNCQNKIREIDVFKSQANVENQKQILNYN